jgi:RNA polymerase sigma factor (sigma-70 family)
MKEHQYLPWPRVDDRTVVEEMLRDPRSGQWFECHEFVKRLVQSQAKNIPQDHWDDLVQETMIRVDKSLLTFKDQCTLRTWLFGIVRSCIIDAYRKFKRAGQFMAPLGDPHDDGESEEDAFTINTPDNTSEIVENELIVHDELKNALAALQEYVSIHAKPARNGQILDMVILQGCSIEEAAKATACSASVAGYTVRSAQQYVREKLRSQK